MEITLLKTIDGYENETFQIENNMTMGKDERHFDAGLVPVNTTRTFISPSLLSQYV